MDWGSLHKGQSAPGWKGPGADEGPVRARGPLCTDLLAVGWGVESVVQAGSVRQAQDVFKQVFGEVLEGRFEDKVANPSVLLVAVVAEIDEVLDVVVGAGELDVLKKRIVFVMRLHLIQKHFQDKHLFFILTKNNNYETHLLELVRTSVGQEGSH